MVALGAVERILQRDDIRGKVPDDLSPEMAYLLGRAIARTVLAEEPEPSVAMGWDSRLSSPTIARELMRGLADEGVGLVELGQCSSELVYFAAGDDPSLGGGIMVTASHNPAEYNGLKMVKRGSVPLDGGDLQAIGTELRRMIAGPARRKVCLAGRYAELIAKVSGVKRAPVVPLKIVVEAGNGMGGQMFAEVSEHLGLQGVEVVYANSIPNGAFPVALPNPLREDYLELLRQRTLDEEADVGLAFDGDADRVAVVIKTDDGVDAIRPPEIVALIAARMLRTSPGAEVMYNVVTSSLVPDRVQALGGVPVMTPVGHSQIKLRMRAPEHAMAIFGGEHSGHYFYRDFYYADSGMTSAFIVLAALREAKAVGEDLFARLAGWRRRYFTAPETNFSLDPSGALPFSAGRQVMQQAVVRARKQLTTAEALRQRFSDVTGVQVRTHYDEAGCDPLAPAGGVDLLRVDVTEPWGEWWFVVRPSGAEPLLRSMVEVVLPEGSDADGEGLLAERYEAVVEVLGRESRV